MIILITGARIIFLYNDYLLHFLQILKFKFVRYYLPMHEECDIIKHQMRGSECVFLISQPILYFIIIYIIYFYFFPKSVRLHASVQLLIIACMFKFSMLYQHFSVRHKLRQLKIGLIFFSCWYL